MKFTEILMAPRLETPGQGNALDLGTRDVRIVKQIPQKMVLDGWKRIDRGSSWGSSRVEFRVNFPGKLIT